MRIIRMLNMAEIFHYKIVHSKIEINVLNFDFLTNEQTISAYDDNNNNKNNKLYKRSPLNS